MKQNYHPLPGAISTRYIFLHAPPAQRILQTSLNTGNLLTFS